MVICQHHAIRPLAKPGQFLAHRTILFDPGHCLIHPSPGLVLIALLPDDGNATSFDRSSINESFKKPFDSALLAERLRTLIGARKELVR